MTDDIEPTWHAVSDDALLVQFGTIADATSIQRVRALDKALVDRSRADGTFRWIRETVPALNSLLVRFDPVETEHVDVATAVLATSPHDQIARSEAHVVEINYEPPHAIDLETAANLAGCTPDALISAHSEATYTVGMYGFVPGSAYLVGVPEAVQVPRKRAASMPVPAGSVIVAGAQCIVLPYAMSTGWHVIGRSPTPLLRDDPEQPFAFEVGDSVRFQDIGSQSLGRD